ncbi:AfsR/SARP family transcriptional regulator [Plantactinospora soyae]|uniref:DNA-binding SARP family transcriptional activator n=1 Tax=Plantactinospora soyae TaxID=1544732 RepID=A0A927RCL0_9ACTN|nr:AfsR/SARP family transcriptional regulator [Plantactinospora soyae]MBE1492781.1 DNA-binding SARP family transcriptional activator [Plantactinospora soyae]
MEFAILGPLEITVAGRRVDLTGDRQRKILGALLLAVEGRSSIDRLVAAVWDVYPPSTARKQVQNCVAALRGRLVRAGAPDTLLETRPSGYQLNVRPEDLDARVFVGRVSAARESAAAGRFEEATAHYRSALGMWRGPVLDDLDSQAVAASAAWLTELQLTASEEFFDLELECGRHERIVGDLIKMCAEFPARERIQGQLMLALHRSGRQVDAILVYRQLCRHLAEELGVVPSADILRLHDQLIGCSAASRR